MYNKAEKTILIVDDTPENVDILRELLFEYNLRIAINGKIAVKVVTSNPIPDLILLDIMMPELNGFEVCKILKNDPKTREIPIVFISSLSEIKDIVYGFELGAVDYITKPFNPAEVNKRVETHIALSSYQKQLENMNYILEQKVQTRTKELQQLNYELTIAKNKAEDLNRLKSFFIANISHELRTPLISILGFSEIVARESENEEHAKFCELILSSGKRLGKTLNDIIALTELEKKKLEISINDIDLVSVLNKSKNHYSSLAHDKNLEFEMMFDFEELIVSTDDNLLVCIIDNIVENAIKFTKYGSVKVKVETANNDAFPQFIIKVTDTGIGISNENLALIFSAFRQESEGYDRSFEGLGIGLTVSKQLVEILKGELSISSKLGEGTEVTVKLPLKRDEENIAQKINDAKQLLKDKETTDTILKPRILLVEDNATNRMLIKRILQEIFITEEAKDGYSAVAMAQMTNYSLILMDINLGAGIDGIETQKRIKQFPNYKNIPIVAITAYAVKEERERFINYGFSDFIQKPVLRDDLFKILTKYTSQ